MESVLRSPLTSELLVQIKPLKRTDLLLLVRVVLYGWTVQVRDRQVPVSQFGLGLEEAHDGVETLV